MPFELFVALRYLRDGRLQTFLILTGIGVGVGVIIFLSALISGLQDSLIDTTLGSQALVTVRAPEDVPRTLSSPEEQVLEVFEVERPAQRVRSIDGWPAVAEMIRGLPGVTAVAPTVTGAGIAVRGLGSVSVSIRGVEPERYNEIVDVRSRLLRGALDLEGFRAVVGVGLAEDLGVDVGGRIRLQVAGGRGGIYTVSGVSDYENAALNEGLVLVSLRSGQTLFDLPGGASALEIRNRDVFAADDLAAEIQDRTGLRTESWIARNANLLTGLRSQSLSSVLIQVFVIIAVALGIASVLSVSVVQRAREIGILRATGTRRGTVTRIFLAQGAILGVVGSMLGIGLGISLSLLFQTTAQNADGSALFPFSLTTVLYARSAGIALMVGLLAAVVPARNAARMDPATVIRDA